MAPSLIFMLVCLGHTVEKRRAGTIKEIKYISANPQKPSAYISLSRQCPKTILICDQGWDMKGLFCWAHCHLKQKLDSLLKEEEENGLATGKIYHLADTYIITNELHKYILNIISWGRTGFQFFGKMEYGKKQSNSTACGTKRNAVEVERETNFLPLARNLPLVWFAQKIRCFLNSALTILHFMGLCSVITMVHHTVCNCLGQPWRWVQKPSHPANTSPALPMLIKSARFSSNQQLIRWGRF